MRLRIVDIDECNREQFYKDCDGKDSFISVEAAFDMLEALPTAKVIEDIKAEIEETKEKTFCTDDEKQGLDVALSVIDKHIGEELPPVTQKSNTGHCKECKYFEYDSVGKVDGIPLIVAHEICNKWGDGCKTKEDGYCFLYEPQESEEQTE